MGRRFPSARVPLTLEHPPVASVTFAPSARTIDPPDLIVLAAVAAVATAKAVRRFRQTVLAPMPEGSARSADGAIEASECDLLPFDEDLMDRFLAAPTDLLDPEAGRLRRLQARRSAGAEAQWRSLAQ